MENLSVFVATNKNLTVYWHHSATFRRQLRYRRQRYVHMKHTSSAHNWMGECVCALCIEWWENQIRSYCLWILLHTNGEQSNEKLVYWVHNGFENIEILNFVIQIKSRFNQLLAPVCFWLKTPTNTMCIMVISIEQNRKKNRDKNSSFRCTCTCPNQRRLRLSICLYQRSRTEASHTTNSIYCASLTLFACRNDRNTSDVIEEAPVSQVMITNAENVQIEKIVSINSTFSSTHTQRLPHK